MNGWYPQAVIEAGPPSKQQAGANPAAGAVLHSAVGYKDGLLYELRRPTSERTAAWHFSVLQDGTVLQHYPITAVLWHSADTWGNANLIGIEHEGGYSPKDEPLTASQRAASVSLVKWIAQQGNWIPSRTGKKTLFEHREIADRPTECPSGRIPWPYYVIQEVPPMTSPPMSLTDPGRLYAYLVSPALAPGTKVIPQAIENNRRVYRVELPLKG